MHQKAVAAEYRWQKQKLLRIRSVCIYVHIMHSLLYAMKERRRQNKANERKNFEISDQQPSLRKNKFSDLQWNANNSQPFSSDYINQFRFLNRSLFVVMMKPLVLTILATIILQVCSLLISFPFSLSSPRYRIICAK